MNFHDENCEREKFEEVSMDNFVDERDYKILENDKYTFFVLGRIMGRTLLTER